jgi:hypothetical protein
MRKFFTNYETCAQIVGKFEIIERKLTLQKSVELLTPRLYWLHFKCITLMSISESSERCERHYEGMISCAESKLAYRDTWQQWFNSFYTKLSALGITPPLPQHPGGGGGSDPLGASLHLLPPLPPPHPASASFADACGGPLAAAVGDLRRLVDELCALGRQGVLPALEQLALE